MEQLNKMSESVATAIAISDDPIEEAAKSGKSQVVYGSPKCWMSKFWRTESSIATEEVHLITEW